MCLCVAPLVGAWIETRQEIGYIRAMSVAPLVGAWIETQSLRPHWHLLVSHPSWVRGLKRQLKQDEVAKSHVAPLVGAWIETLTDVSCSWILLSHPSWVRGLKQKTNHDESNYKSRTPRGCVD